MSPTQKKRLLTITVILAGMTLTTLLALKAMQSSIEYFITPSEVKQTQLVPNQQYKVAGLVKKSSLQRLEDGVTQRFIVTDCEAEVTVQFTGILPDLFREGQAIVSAGKFDQQQIFIANQVLAKHDENYVPKEAAAAMMQAQANKCETTSGPIAI